MAGVRAHDVAAMRHVRMARTRAAQARDDRWRRSADAPLLRGAYARLRAVLMSLTFFSTSERADAPLVAFTVYGKPEPQGSVKAFVPTYKSGQPVRRDGGQIVVNLTTDNPALKAWRQGAKVEALGGLIEYGASIVPSEGAVRVEATFYLQRPKAHCGTGRNANTVKASAPAHPVGRPDVDKLLRALLDALTDTVVADDSQVVETLARKVYCGPLDEPRCEVSVFALAPVG
jgi:Holliday junction resolvase RusA-like endonuclease